jgi:hypothetical protein
MRMKTIKKLIRVRDILDKKLNGTPLTDGDITFTLKNESMFTVEAIKSNPYATTFVEFAQRLEENARKRQLAKQQEEKEVSKNEANSEKLEALKLKLENSVARYKSMMSKFDKLPDIVIK